MSLWTQHTLMIETFFGYAHSQYIFIDQTNWITETVIQSTSSRDFAGSCVWPRFQWKVHIFIYNRFIYMLL